MESRVLHSKIYGQGRAVILLHGVFGLSANWAPLASVLAGEKFQAHVLDLRGHGRSFRDPDMSLGAMADDVARYMDAAGLETAALLGHSMGGKVAMEFACRYLQRCERLVVVDISPRTYNPGWIKELAETAVNIEDSEPRSREQARARMEQKIGEAGWEALLGQNLYRKKDDAYGFRFDARMIRNDAGALTASLAEGSVFPKKTLFIRGENSDYMTERDEAILKIHFPDSRIVPVTGAGHWVHVDTPARFGGTILKFLGE